jgi:hypothetical protein
MLYQDQVATTGNVASPLSPHELAAGPVFLFNVYHLMDLETNKDSSLFPISFADIQNNNSIVQFLGLPRTSSNQKIWHI